MSARTYICVDCRWARRAPAAYGLNTNLRCPTCGGSLYELEWRWRIPRKTNERGWKELAAKVARETAELVPRRREVGAEKLAKIDKEIATTELQRESDRKQLKLRKLRKERLAVQLLYASSETN